MKTAILNAHGVPAPLALAPRRRAALGPQALSHCLMALALSGTASVASLAQTPADRPIQTFRSSADVVSIQAFVRDKRGRPMHSLTTGDFEVRDNGQVRPILSLRADRQSPVSLAILVDMSGSMSVASKMGMARQAFDTILSQLRDGQDEVALFTFDSALHERHSFTTNLVSLRGALDDFRPFGSTSLYDATAATARRLADQSSTHKAVIILTDGSDTSSTLTAPEVSGVASSIDVPVYVVATVPPLDQASIVPTTDRRAPASDGADLRDLAEWTGGQLVFASSLGETTAATARLLDELRQRYVLAIEAANSNEWRPLEVRVKHPSATVKARSGYFGG
jgi:VWFA-related protein